MNHKSDFHTFYQLENEYLKNKSKLQKIKNSRILRKLNSFYSKFFDTKISVERFESIAKEYIKELNFIDPLFYSYSSKEIIESKKEAIDYFWETGFGNSERPNLFFNLNYYLAANPDLVTSQLNPVIHFLDHGFYEGRNCHEIFSAYKYLSKKYPDETPSIARLMSDYYSGELSAEAVQPFNMDPCDFKILKLFRQMEAAKKSSDNQPNFCLSEKPKVSVIIPVYNQLEITINCLYALALNPPAVTWEIILIDDCSKSEVAEKLSQIKNIRYVRNENNLGFLKSCNKAASLAKGEYLIFLNNDTCPLKGWVDALLKTFVDHPTTGLAGSKLIYPNGQLQEAGGLIWSDASGTNCGKFQCPDHPSYNYLREVDYCSGASIMVPKKLWDQIGGFDELFVPAYYEDTDLCFSIRKAGYKVLYQPSSEVLHFEGVSSGTDLGSGIKKHQVINKEKFKTKWSEELKRQGSEICHQNLYSVKPKPLALVIDHQVPTPDQDAGSVYSYNFIKLLNEKYRIDFFSDHGVVHKGIYTQQLQEMGVRCIYGPWFAYPFKDMNIDWANLDLVVIQRHNILSTYIDVIKERAPQAKILFITHDLHFVRIAQQAEIEDSDLIRQAAKITKGSELSAIVKSDATIVLGAKETEIVKEYLPKAKCYQLPFWEDVYTEVKPFQNRKDIFFLGGFNHPPNGDALTYFLEDIWPLVSPKLPGVKFYVFGSNIPEKFNKYASETVVIGGFVPDLKPIFDDFRLNIAPLRYGAGQNGKVVASLCRGLPTVISTIAASGISLVDGVDTLIADSPKDFSEKIIKLYSDQTLWESISNNSLEFARNKLSIANAERILSKILEDLNSED